MTKSAFHWQTGEPSIFLQDPRFNRYAKTGQIATEAVEAMRAEGRDNSTIYGLSPKADDMVSNFKRNNLSFDPDPQQSADKTQCIKKGGI